MQYNISEQFDAGSDLRILLNVDPRITLISGSSRPGSADAKQAAEEVLNFEFDSYQETGPGSAIRLVNDRISLSQLNEYLDNLSSLGHDLTKSEFSITAKPNAQRKYTGIEARGEEMRLQGFVGMEIPRSAGSITEVQEAFNSNMIRNLEDPGTKVDEVEDTRVIYTEGNMITLARDGQRFDNGFADDLGLDKQSLVYVGATRGRFV